MSSEGKWDFSNRVFAVLVVFIVVAFIYGLAAALANWKDYTGDFPREISVEGVGTSYSVPDVAKVNLGVSTEGQDSAQVVEENTKKVNAIIASVESQGVEKKDIQTVNYYLNPNYKYTPERGSYQDGYILNQSLEVKVRDFEKIGAIIAASSKLGANTVGGISFDLEDESSATDKAREDAIAKAKEKARNIAKQTGLHLGKVVNFYEYSDGPIEAYGMGGGVMMDKAAEGPIAPQVEPGQKQVKLHVTLTYKLR